MAIMQRLNFKYPHRLVWQSKVGPLPWLSPATDKAIRAYAEKGIRNFVVIPIAFVNEHIETLHELDIEYGHDLKKEVSRKYMPIPRFPIISLLSAPALVSHNVCCLFHKLICFATFS
jgi:protoheme ferro-lyase